MKTNKMNKKLKEHEEVMDKIKSFSDKDKIKEELLFTCQKRWEYDDWRLPEVVEFVNYETQKQATADLIKKIKEYKFNIKNNSFERKTKDSYERITCPLFLEELKQMLVGKC